MSHEIRTPMNAIIGIADLMQTKPLDREQMTCVRAVRSAALGLLEIINDILDISKVDAQKMEIIPRTFDLASLIGDVLNIVNIRAAENGLVLTASLSNNMPPLVYNDDIRIKQCLVNLLNNAVKFTEKGAVQLRVWVEAAPDPSGFRLCFSVHDTGIGIKQEDRDKLFSEFQQLDTHKNRHLTGTGLGLAITRRLVELMDGSISVESVYGKGTVFTFFVPCPVMADGEEIPAWRPHQTKLTAVENPQALRLLIFESSRYNAGIFREMIQELELTGEVYSGVEEALLALANGAYTHVFFDIKRTELFRPFFDRSNAHFTMLKGLHEHYDREVPSVLDRPIIITALADVLNGRNEDAQYTQETAFTTKNVRILVVDDNQVNRMVAEGHLRHYGIAVDTASSGDDAIKKIQCRVYDIVFMDHMMPGMDGIEAAMKIRSMGFRELVIITLTANSFSGAREQFTKAGMNDYLAKPIDARAMSFLLRKYLPPNKIITK